MCKTKVNFARLVFVFLFALPVSFLYAEQGQGFISTSNSTVSEILSKPQTPENYSGGSDLLLPNSDGQTKPLLNPDNPWQDLRKWISEGLQGLDESTESLMILEGQLAELRAENSEQESLLRQSQELLMNLKKSLAEAQNSVDVAIDRMQDAEDYALYIDAQNILLKQKVQLYKKSAPINFAFGGVAFGIGVPLIIEGVRSDNRSMLWSGVGVVGVGSLVWVTGHFIFKWW